MSVAQSIILAGGPSCHEGGNVHAHVWISLFRVFDARRKLNPCGSCVANRRVRCAQCQWATQHHRCASHAANFQRHVRDGLPNWARRSHNELGRTAPRNLSLQGTGYAACLRPNHITYASQQLGPHNLFGSKRPVCRKRKRGTQKETRRGKESLAMSVHPS